MDDMLLLFLALALLGGSVAALAAKRSILITAVFACVACLAHGQGTFLLGNIGVNIVTNGSFEDFTFSPDTTLPGWTWRTCLIYADGSDGIPAASGLRFPG
jgi:hypothetical protein